MGELTALPDPLAGINNIGDLLLRAGEGAGGKRRRGGRERGGQRMGREEKEWREGKGVEGIAVLSIFRKACVVCKIETDGNTLC